MPFLLNLLCGKHFELRVPNYSAMNFNNFTIKAQEAVQKASEITVGNQQQAIETAHLLKGLLLVDENVISYLLKKLNVNLNRLNEQLDSQINSFPKVSGSDVYLSSTAN